MKYIHYVNGEKTPITNIYCIGQNYIAHNKEMGTQDYGDIVVFMKPTSSVIYNGGKVLIPFISNNLHYEVEMLIAISEDGYNLSTDEVVEHIGGVGIGVDLTLRDIQKIAKDNKKPWGVAKGFYTSAPISNFIPMYNISNFNFDLSLNVNGEIRQSGNSKDMMHTVEELVSFISKVFSIQKGDIIFTGTPAGVGQLLSGDNVTATLGKNEIELNFSVK